MFGPFWGCSICFCYWKSWDGGGRITVAGGGRSIWPTAMFGPFWGCTICFCCWKPEYGGGRITVAGGGGSIWPAAMFRRGCIVICFCCWKPGDGGGRISMARPSGLWPDTGGRSPIPPASGQAARCAGTSAALAPAGGYPTPAATASLAPASSQVQCGTLLIRRRHCCAPALPGPWTGPAGEPACSLRWRGRAAAASRLQASCPLTVLSTTASAVLSLHYRSPAWAERPPPPRSRCRS
jgi:hypothetical protein